jgi:hypothetical protein
MSPLNAYASTMALSILSVGCTLLNTRAIIAINKVDKIAILIFTFVGAAFAHLSHKRMQLEQEFTRDHNSLYNIVTCIASSFFWFDSSMRLKFPDFFAKQGDNSYKVGFNLGFLMMNAYKHYQFTKRHLEVRG